MNHPPPIRVTVIAVSAGACAGKPTWQSAASVLRTRLERRFGSSVSVEYVEFFSARCLEFESVMQGIAGESLRLPVVLVNGEVHSSGLKLNEGQLAREVQQLLNRI
jgi:disulfide oxidoreductase YuzD